MSGHIKRVLRQFELACFLCGEVHGQVGGEEEEEEEEASVTEQRCVSHTAAEVLLLLLWRCICF
jgi:hypothetical protein